MEGQSHFQACTALRTCLSTFEVKEKTARQHTSLTASQVKGGKQHNTPVDQACQSSEDEQVSEDDGFDARALHLDSNFLTSLPQHSLVDLSQGCCSNGPL